jgi:hypothetical protein
LEFLRSWSTSPPESLSLLPYGPRWPVDTGEFFHDEAITAILSAIRELTNPPAQKRRGIGFTADLR